MTEKRPLGLAMATALVVGSMIGSGVFLLPSTLAPYGAASLIGWALALGGTLLLALVHAWMAAHLPRSGGPYAYARAAFGDLAGFVVAWSYWISLWCGNAAIAVAFAASISALSPQAVPTPLAGAAWALAALWLCTAINVAGVRKAGWVQLITTILKVVPLLLFATLGAMALQPGAWQPFNPSGLALTGVAAGTAALALWAFIGFEAATVPAESVRDAERNVPRATLAGVLIAGLATLLACTVVIGLVPAGLLTDSPAPMAEAAQRLWGPHAGTALILAAAVSAFGALNGWVLVQAQIPLAAARDGLFPPRFATVDARGTPRFALLVGSMLASLLILASSAQTLVALFAFAILLSTATTLLPYAFTVAAWWRMRSTASGIARRLVAVVALVFALWALWGTGIESLSWGAVLILAGVPLYLWLRRTPVPGTEL